MNLKDLIRSIPDYPKPGIVFRDITTLLQHPRGFRQAVDELIHPYSGTRID
jgi:adenine phosphoribosyltransferase